MKKVKQSIRIEKELETSLKLISFQLDISYNGLVEMILKSYVDKVKQTIETKIENGKNK